MEGTLWAALLRTGLQDKGSGMAGKNKSKRRKASAAAQNVPTRRRRRGTENKFYKIVGWLLVVPIGLFVFWLFQ